jgi:tRNA synthetases class I (I, L, M and V)
MPYAQLHYPFENVDRFEKGFPADFIAEGLDQTRGWFYTLMVISTCLFNKPGESWQSGVLSRDLLVYSAGLLYSCRQTHQCTFSLPLTSLNVSHSFPIHVSSYKSSSLLGSLHTSSHYISLAFKNLIVNGLVLASDGKKMSKRLSNYPDPLIVLKKYGAGRVLDQILESPSLME